MGELYHWEDKVENRIMTHARAHVRAHPLTHTLVYWWEITFHEKCAMWNITLHGNELVNCFYYVQQWLQSSV